MSNGHALTDKDADLYLKIGITAEEVVYLRDPSLTADQAAWVLWERTPFPLIQGIHDIADFLATLNDQELVTA